MKNRKVFRRRQGKNNKPGKLIRVAGSIIRILSKEAKRLISEGLINEIKEDIGKIKRSYINVIKTPLNSKPSKIGTRRIVGGLAVRVDRKGREYFKHSSPSSYPSDYKQYLRADGTLNYDNQGRLTKVF